jgi:uncharacterized protein
MQSKSVLKSNKKEDEMSTQYCTHCGKPLKPHARFCSQCGHNVGRNDILTNTIIENQIRKSTKSNVQRSTTKKVIVGLFAVVIGILFFLVFQFITYEEHGVIAQQPVVTEPVHYTGEPLRMTEIQAKGQDGYFILYLEEIKENKFIRAWYDAPTTQLPVIAYISPKGRLVTAIGITEPCGESNYTIVDNHIHCSNCTGEWDMNSMQPFGSCPKYYPEPIKSEIDGNMVLIAEADLESWRRRW